MNSFNRDNRIKLFCLPYAGGSSVIYHPWKAHIGDQIELIPVELAGRGRRINENPYRNIDEAVEDVYQFIKDQIQFSPYMIFGHSMGAMIAYELTQKIRREGAKAPLHVFFSGKGALHVERPDKVKLHLLDDSAFKKEVIDLGGTPPEFFEYPELMELFLPLLKNDFRVAETYKFKSPIQPFDQDITVLLGKEDDLNEAQCQEWVEHSTAICLTHYFEGGHFFINDEQDAILQIIQNAVKTYAFSPLLR